jgi:hypothetical protein
MSVQKFQGVRAAQDAAALRKQVLEDPFSLRISKHLGVPLEEYVHWVVHYVLHPRDEPGFYVVEDKALSAMGLQSPEPEVMGRFVKEANARITAEEKEAERGEAPERMEPPPEAELEKKPRMAKLNGSGNAG